ncbi:MAG: hypothetical protein EBS55_15180, partial [Flavobacteriaceae bacterium]|nr:hypothetical protein [Flavobacteriaceae bacterium]
MPLVKRRSSIVINTGQFVTTGQTGSFGFTLDTGQFVTTGQTGSLAFTLDTGQFVTTGQTGSFGFTLDTGQFVTTGQTGSFALSFDTGVFVSTGMTGDFVLSCSLSGINELNFGFPTFGNNGSKYNNEEFVFSNSLFPIGESQFSYLICSVETQGSLFSNEVPNPTGYIYINLPNAYKN